MEYKKCLTQLDEIIKYLKFNELQKIPDAILNGIKLEKDKDFIWNYDKNKSFDEQNIDRQTLAMLSYLNMEYIATKEQKEFLNEYYRFNDKTLNATQCIRKNNIIVKNNGEEVSLVEMKKEKWYKKILQNIKKIFKI